MHRLGLMTHFPIGLFCNRGQEDDYRYFIVLEFSITEPRLFDIAFNPFFVLAM